MGTRSSWVVGRKKSENSFREDWIDQREREREAGLLGCPGIKELVLRFAVRRLIRFVSGG